MVQCSHWIEEARIQDLTSTGSCQRRRNPDHRDLQTSTTATDTQAVWRTMSRNESDIEGYILTITKAFQGIREVWLIGSRANGEERPDSDWDFFVFTDEKTFRHMRKQPSFKRPDVDLLVVYNDQNFEEPWPESSDKRPLPKRGSLDSTAPGWNWMQISDVCATYKATKDNSDEDSLITQTKKALRIWPPSPMRPPAVTR